MKKLLGSTLVIIAAMFASNASAAYFRFMDPSHPTKVVGAFIDPIDLGKTSASAPVAIVTHAVKDGCLFPTLACLDWSPLVAGLGYNGGRFEFNVGPAANLTPIAKGAILALLDKLTADETLSGVKSILGSQPISGPDVSLSFGPALNVAPIERGVILPLSEWKGRFRVFAGAAFRFP